MNERRRREENVGEKSLSEEHWEMWQQERSFNQLEPIETQQYQVTSNDRHHSSPYYDSRHRRLQPLARSPAVGWIGLYVRQHYVRVFLYVSLSVSVCFCLSPPASIFACLSLSLCEPIVPLFIRCARISESMYISLRAIVFPS